jgi:hypothetical protein
LEQLAGHSALRLILADIAATDEERVRFGKAHPHLRVVWLELPKRSSLSSSQLRDPWLIALWRIGDWRSDESGDYRIALTRSIVNLSGIKLTRERLGRLPPQVFPEIIELRCGTFDSTTTAADLIQRCKNMEYLQSLETPLDEGQLDALLRHASVRNLKVVQGNLPVAKFMELAAVPTVRWLEIYESTLTPAEAQHLREAFLAHGADRFVDVYPGPFDSPGESILDKSLRPAAALVRPLSPALTPPNW